MTCLFCRIANKELPASLVYEDASVVAFKDIHPKAPTHLLLVPRQHIASVASLTEADQAVAGALLLAARTIATAQGVAEQGYRLVVNVGRGGGQVIDHLHVHLLAGQPLDPGPG